MKPASNALVSFNSGLAFALGPPSEVCCPLSACEEVWCVMFGPASHCHGGENRSQAGDEGLQMADRLHAASAAPNLKLLWGGCQGLVHDVFVI